MPPAKSNSAWNFETDSTLIRVLARNAEAFPASVAMREKSKGIWKQTTWRELLDTVLGCAAGIEELGFKAGDVMLVLGDNRPRLYAGMWRPARSAAMPCRHSRTPRSMRSATSFTRPARVSRWPRTRSRSTRSLDLREQGAVIEHIIYDDPRGIAAYADPGLISWDALQAKGAERLARDPHLGEELIARAKPAGPAVFVHSSGSTGKPKGIVLSHQNLLAGVRNAYRGGAFQFGESVLAYRRSPGSAISR